jgi:alditol oxidase
MRLVDGRGRLVTLAPGDPRLEGARVHLGALGVVTELALRVEPTFALAETVEPIPVERVAEALPAIARRSVSS